MFSFFKRKVETNENADTFSSGKIFPRIKTIDFLKITSKIPGMTPDQMPISSPIAGDLVLTFAMEVGDLFVSLTPRECKRLKIDSAVESLTRNSRITIADAMDSSFEVQAYDGEAFRITIKPDMDACSMIEPGIWINFAAQKDDSLIAIFPHRNLAFFAAKQEVEGVNALKRFMRDVDFSHTHALSRNFYAWEKNAWSVANV